ncbi:MAG: hypothetical protein KGZ74_07065 [Chitinophagaceae bacterium]|nr:hypothetical protein [Chitinophagaceae bacterium]
MIADVHKPKKYLDIKSTIFRKGKKDIIICDFDQVFNIEKKNLNIFYISRPAFYNKASLICDTLNIFMKHYDKDKELITCYVNMKAMCDLSNYKYSFTSFMDDIINRLFSKSMIKKIEFFVEDQYRINLESSIEKDKYKDNPQQFTNEHGKILMAISTAIKICIPIVSHYYSVREDMVQSLSLKNYLYTCFYSLFPLFEKNSNIYNKIYATVDNAINTSTFSDSGMWKRNKNKGITPSIAKNRITKMVIQDLMYKYTFNAIMINLNYAGIRKALKYLVEGKDTHDYVDINTKRSNNKMSGLEQLEMNAARVDERDIIISSHGSKSKVKRLSSKYNVEIKEEDIDFYKDNIELNGFQTSIILQFFAEDFKGMENMKFIKRKDFYKLLIIMKTHLKRKGFKMLPELLSGNTSKKIKGRRIGSKKLAKIKQSPRYINLLEQYSDVKDVVTENLILKHISVFINTPMTYVDHEKKELLGEEIKINEDIVSDEVIRLIELF